MHCGIHINIPIAMKLTIFLRTIIYFYFRLAVELLLLATFLFMFHSFPDQIYIQMDQCEAYWNNKSTWPLLRTFSMQLTKRKHQKCILLIWRRRQHSGERIDVLTKTWYERRKLLAVLLNKVHRSYREFYQHSHNGNLHWNFQIYSVKIIYTIIDWVWLGIPNTALWDAHQFSQSALIILISHKFTNLTKFIILTR